MRKMINARICFNKDDVIGGGVEDDFSEEISELFDGLADSATEPESLDLEESLTEGGEEPKDPVEDLIKGDDKEEKPVDEDSEIDSGAAITEPMLVAAASVQ